MKIIYLILLLLVPAHLAVAATNDITALVQKGLFEEEANHNLAAAMQQYQAAIGNFDQNRKLVATAIFRVGECYRKQGQTNEATAAYQRILREFSDQAELVKLCEEYTNKKVTPTGGTTSDEKPREMKYAINEARRRETEAKQLLDRVNKFNHDEAIAFFTIIEPDETLNMMVQMSDSAQRGFKEATVDFGPKSPNYQAAKMKMDSTADSVRTRVKSLEWSLEQRYQGAKDRRLALEEQVKLSTNAIFSVTGPGDNSVSSAAPAANPEDEEIRKIKAMLQNSPDLINARDDSGRTPLTEAVNHGFLNAAKFLITNGANVNGAGDPPLLQAGFFGNKAMVELLLANGANVNVSNKSGETALHAAAARGFKSVVEVLLSHGAEVDIKDTNGITPLLRASAGGKTQVVELLIEHQANTESRDRHQQTPLYHAVRAGQIETVRVLLLHKAGINAASESGLTPLYAAMDLPGTEMVKLLLENGADVEAEIPENAQNKTLHPLHYAVQKGRADLVELLLDHKANPNQLVKWDADEGVSPLILALDYHTDSTTKILEMLLTHGADPNIASSSSLTPLLLASGIGNKAAVQLLLAHQANVNVIGHDGVTPLGYAQSAQSPMRQIPNTSHYVQPSLEVAALLLNAGADKDYERKKYIYISRNGKNEILFTRNTNDWNHYTLFEFLGVSFIHGQISAAFSGNVNRFGPSFPDFAHVTIYRLASGGQKEIKVDVAALLQAPPQIKDIPLEWGDIVELPELDHPINETWQGLPEEKIEVFNHFLTRTVSITVKGEMTQFILRLPLSHPYLKPKSAESSGAGKVLECEFDLRSVIEIAQVLRVSSDFAQIKVERKNTSSGKTETRSFNINVKAGQLWLKDGDKIEIPEREGPAAP